MTSLVTNKSRVMVLSSQNNAMSMVLFREGTAALAKIAVERDLVVISEDFVQRPRDACVARVKKLESSF